MDTGFEEQGVGVGRGRFLKRKALHCSFRKTPQVVRTHPQPEWQIEFKNWNIFWASTSPSRTFTWLSGNPVAAKIWAEWFIDLFHPQLVILSLIWDINFWISGVIFMQLQGLLQNHVRILLLQTQLLADDGGSQVQGVDYSDPLVLSFTPSPGLGPLSCFLSLLRIMSTWHFMYFFFVNWNTSPMKGETLLISFSAASPGPKLCLA